LMASVAATGPVPEMVAGCVTVQVGGSSVPTASVTAQVSATPPVKPPLGVTVIIEVPPVPGETMLIGVPLTTNVGVSAEGVTVRPMLVVSTVFPALPVTVAV
jgi:hypothetical protein